MFPTRTTIKDGLLVVDQTQDGRCTHLALGGELDLANAATLELTLHEALNLGQEVVVDLGRLEFLDSTGISLLVMACKAPTPSS
jgi:anti-anti-sigma factor